MPKTNVTATGKRPPSDQINSISAVYDRSDGLLGPVRWRAVLWTLVALRILLATVAAGRG